MEISIWIPEDKTTASIQSRAYLAHDSVWYHMLDFTSNLPLCVIINRQFVMFRQYQPHAAVVHSGSVFP